ncbi:type IV pilin [Halobellus rubicundus]|uniref:Type IV pilin n=1 Tax=Halobellus rubicundus TaxID=2996466 RepID=A0ABD5MLD6_9EURY
MTARASAPAVGVVLLLLVGVGLGSVVAAGADAVAAGAGVDLAADAGGDAPGPIALSLRLDGDAITLTHEAGAPLSVADLRLVVAVDGRELRHQPPVPFFAARGFRAGPTGPFNVAGDGVWSAGESASFRLASTNAPGLAPGRTVSVTVAVKGRTVGSVRGVV